MRFCQVCDLATHDKDECVCCGWSEKNNDFIWHA